MTAAASLRRWVFGAGVFNVASAALLAVPGLYQYQYALLNAANRMLGLGGDALVAPREGINMLFVNTAGLMLCSVGLMLIYAARDTGSRGGVAVINAVTRVAWSGGVLYYLVTEHVARIVVAFVVSDLTFACVIIYYWLNDVPGDARLRLIGAAKLRSAGER